MNMLNKKKKTEIANHPISHRSRWHLWSASVLSCTALLFGTLFGASGLAQAACASTPDPNQGTDTQTINVKNAGTYYMWSQVLAADSTNNSYYLQVDGGCAINVGDSANMPTSWTWVGYHDGGTCTATNTSGCITVSLSAGQHTVLMTGREPGVGVDQVLLLSDAPSACTPTGDGSNCTPIPDTTPPTASMSAPASGANVSGTTTVSANASDNVQVANVQFKLDGNNLGPAINTPASATTYSYSWNTSGVPNGSHTLTAVATDTSGLTATASSVTVNVNNSTGTTAPSAPTSLTATAASSTQIDLSWKAPTTGTVTKYNVYRNGSSTALATINAPTTSYSDMTVSASTTYSYTVTALNSANQESAKSTAASVTTPAGADKTPPVVSITAPGANATVSGTTTLSASATDNIRVASVQFEVDGAALGAAITTPTTGTTYSYPWNTTSLKDGSTHTLTAVASDGSNITTAKSITVTVNNSQSTGGGTTPTSVQNLAWNSSSKTLSWSAYPGASSYVVAQVHNPTSTRNTNYSWPHVSGTSCTMGGTCNITVIPNSGETVNYGILPLDNNGNSLPGASWAKEITVTWPTIPDTQPPSQPTHLTATAASSSQINLAWTASTDNVGVTGYQIYRSSGNSTPSQIGTSTKPSYGDSGLNANTTYTYYVIALDSAKNQSKASALVNATTNSTAAQTATIEGVISSSSTSKPIGGALIRTGTQATAAGAITTYTNAQGQYLLTGIDTINKHNYYISARGYASQHYFVSFSPGIHTHVNVRLTPN